MRQTRSVRWPPSEISAGPDGSTNPVRSAAKLRPAGLGVSNSRANGGDGVRPYNYGLRLRNGPASIGKFDVFKT